MRLAKARLKPSHELPEWDNCCEEAIRIHDEQYAEESVMDVDLDHVGPYPPQVVGHCGQQLHYDKGVMVVVDGKDYGWVPLDNIESVIAAAEFQE